MTAHVFVMVVTDDSVMQLCGNYETESRPKETAKKQLALFIDHIESVLRRQSAC